MYAAGATNYHGSMARHLQVREEGKASRHADSVDLAARYLVYNLFIAISAVVRFVALTDEGRRIARRSFH